MRPTLNYYWDCAGQCNFVWPGGTKTTTGAGTVEVTTDGCAKLYVGGLPIDVFALADF